MEHRSEPSDGVRPIFYVPDLGARKSRAPETSTHSRLAPQLWEFWLRAIDEACTRETAGMAGMRAVSLRSGKRFLREI